MTNENATILEFLNAAAAKQPTPGGGAVAALAGALAASMGEMVLNYSVAKKDLLQHSESNKASLHELTTARAMLIELMREDQEAYQAYTDARKAGADLTELTQTCIRVPQTIGTTAIAILEVANRVASTSNRWLLSDLAVCGELAMATVRCAVHNVRVNLSELPADQRKKIDADCDALLTRGVGEIKKLIPAIRSIQSSP